MIEPSITPLKRKVWKLKTVRKIHHFLWQALSGCVSSASKLVERHCGTDKSCQRCGDETEDINHILFLCPPAFQCWILSPIPSPPGVFPCTSLYQNFDYLFQLVQAGNIHKDTCEMFPWLLWFVWKARNEKCFNAKDISPIDTVQLAVQEAETWRVAQVLQTTTEDEPPTEQRRSTEQREQTMRYLCQVDGSWSDKEEWMGLGFVLYEGSRVILQGQKCLPRAQDPLMIEAEGLVWAMKEVRDRGFEGIRFSSDCQQLINLIIRNDDWSALASELDEIKFFSSLFHEVSFSFIPRSENFRANSLAKGGRSRAHCFTGVDDLVQPLPALEAGWIELEEV